MANTLILSLLLGGGALACGKFGPPVRVYREAPATVQPSQADDADEADDETEPEPDRP